MKKITLLTASVLLAAGAFAQETTEPATPMWVVEVNCTEPADVAGVSTYELTNTGAKNGEFEIFSCSFTLPDAKANKPTKNFITLTYTPEDGSAAITAKPNSNGAIYVQPNAGDLTITVSSFKNAKGLQTVWSTTAYGLTDAKRRALAYFTPSVSGESATAYFNNAINNCEYKVIQGNKGSTVNYVSGSNADVFTFTPKQKWATGIYKTTLDYTTMDFAIEAAQNIEVNIDSFCTFVAPADVIIPEGVKAYTLKYNAETPDTLDAVKVESGTLAANTPVVVKAETSGVYTFDITSAASYTTEGETADTFIHDVTTEDNVLTGVFQPHNIVDGTNNDGVYPFANGAFNLWDGKDSTDGKGKVVNWHIVYPFTAYVVLPADVTERPESLAINFPTETGGDPTGIDSITLDKESDARTYNLLGMPVDEDYKGIVIRNGKKQIQK